MLTSDRDYDLMITDGGRTERHPYHVQTIADRPPILAVSGRRPATWTPLGGKVPIAGRRRLPCLTSLAYETAVGAGMPRSRTGRTNPRAQVQADWDAGDLPPGQSALFGSSCDNDRVSGPHVTQSAHFDPLPDASEAH